MKLKTGETAPNFSLLDTNNELVELKDLIAEGKLLIIFFPFAFSGTCTGELCGIRDNMKLYNAFKTRIVGISVDSHFTLKEFKKANNLNFMLLSDFNKEVIEAYNVNFNYKGMKGVSKRAAFIINVQQRITYSQVLDDAGQTLDFKKIQKELRS